MPRRAPLVPDFPLDVWIDKDRHTRRLTEHFSVQGATVRVAMTLSNFGTAPLVEVPNATDAFRVESFQRAVEVVIGS